MTDDTLRRLRRRMISVAHASGEGHLPSSFSVLPILWLLYDEVMDQEWDKFVLSKGHAALGLYAVLSELFPVSLDDFCRDGTSMYGHPDHRAPGVECSTGSLGHGMPMAVGMAYAKKLKGEPGRIYCLVGDGECMEGSIWEAATLAVNLKLDNLTVIVDNNDTHPVGSLARKFLAFGWAADHCSAASSHDMRQAMTPVPGKPLCVVAQTVKGDGCKPMVDDPGKWHHAVPKDEAERDTLLEACA